MRSNLSSSFHKKIPHEEGVFYGAKDTIIFELFAMMMSLLSGRELELIQLIPNQHHLNKFTFLTYKVFTIPNKD